MAKEYARRRTIKKVYDLPNGNITVLFPKFITELHAVSLEMKTDSVQEIISRLQGWCLTEGIKPDYGKWTNEDTNQEKKQMRMKERAARMRDKKEQLRRERESAGDSFPDRVTKTRKVLGDY